MVDTTDTVDIVNTVDTSDTVNTVDKVNFGGNVTLLTLLAMLIMSCTSLTSEKLSAGSGIAAFLPPNTDGSHVRDRVGRRGSLNNNSKTHLDKPRLGSSLGTVQAL